VAGLLAADVKGFWIGRPGLIGVPEKTPAIRGVGAGWVSGRFAAETVCAAILCAELNAVKNVTSCCLFGRYGNLPYIVWEYPGLGCELTVRV
jgi:hypothetical protein